RFTLAGARTTRPSTVRIDHMAVGQEGERPHPWVAVLCDRLSLRKILFPGVAPGRIPTAVQGASLRSRADHNHPELHRQVGSSEMLSGVPRRTRWCSRSREPQEAAPPSRRSHATPGRMWRGAVYPLD